MASTGKLSTPTAVASIITHNPPLYECLRQRLLNYHALAASIRPDVERMVGRPTTINTIVVAIARFSDVLEGTAGPTPPRLLRDARITVSSDVVDVTIKGKRSELAKVLKRLADLTSGLDEPTHLFQLSNSIKLIADEGEYASKIRPYLDNMLIARETTQLSRLDVRLSEKVEVTLNFGVFLTELLYRHGISIRQIYIGEETVLIVGRDDGPRAYDILRQEVDNAREERADVSDVASKRVRQPVG